MALSKLAAAPTSHPWRWAVGVWALGALALWLGDGVLGLQNQALLLVLTAALAALWSSPGAALAACGLAVLLFDLCLVSPRGTLAVNLQQDALLLLTVLGVSALIAGLMARQHRLAQQARQQADDAQQLRALGEHLREADHPQDALSALQTALQRLSGGPVALWLAATAERPDHLLGPADALQRQGLAAATTQHAALGPGTGRHDEQPAWYLPLRGRRASFGAAVLTGPGVGPGVAAQRVRAQAQALCDQMGLALARHAAQHHAREAQTLAQTQAVQNTLLAAIAHDHRTPLATILGAASALHDQAERLSRAQQTQLAATIVDEAQHLARITDNTLQLARLDAADRALQTDWEAVADLLGPVLRHARQRHPGLALDLQLHEPLPLVRCDAVRVVQLLDNLVDNAVHHGGGAQVVLQARALDRHLLLSVKDRGPGVPPAAQALLFQPFQSGPARAGAPRRGAGLGLAVCQAIARAHGGELRHRPRRQGGTVMEFWLPLPPDAPPATPKEPPCP